jgi:hypothetical protein
VHPQPAELREIAPELRQAFLPGIQVLPGGGQDTPPLDEAPHRRGQFAMFRSDRQTHGAQATGAPGSAIWPETPGRAVPDAGCVPRRAPAGRRRTL